MVYESQGSFWVIDDRSSISKRLLGTLREDAG